MAFESDLLPFLNIEIGDIGFDVINLWWDYWLFDLLDVIWIFLR